jgi:hypothetical protein
MNLNDLPTQRDGRFGPNPNRMHFELTPGRMLDVTI